LGESRRKGVQTVSLSVAMLNRCPSALYDRHGFTAVEEDEGTLQMLKEGQP
jgi:hypothetical protein